MTADQKARVESTCGWDVTRHLQAYAAARGKDGRNKFAHPPDVDSSNANYQAQATRCLPAISNTTHRDVFARIIKHAREKSKKYVACLCRGWPAHLVTFACIR